MPGNWRNSLTGQKKEEDIRELGSLGGKPLEIWVTTAGPEAMGLKMAELVVECRHREVDMRDTR